MKKGDEDNSFGVVAVVMGILGIIIGLNGLILGIIAIVFSNKQKKIKKNKWSKAGMILGILGIVLNIIMLIIIFKFPQLLTI